MNIELEDHGYATFLLLPLRIIAHQYRTPQEKSTYKFLHKCLISSVVMSGIEPPTQGFSVLCSTN
jgi:hypothetical protein